MDKTAPGAKDFVHTLGFALTDSHPVIEPNLVLRLVSPPEPPAARDPWPERRAAGQGRHGDLLISPGEGTANYDAVSLILSVWSQITR